MFAYFVFASFFLVVKTTIVVQSVNKVVLENRVVVFKCATNLTNNSIQWFHTPARSNTPIKFYSKGYVLNTAFYMSAFSFNTLGGGEHELMISSATAKHAGKYECSDDEDSASAELGVVENKRNSMVCRYVNNADLTETEITCDFLMAGTIEPEMTCLGESESKESSVFGRRGMFPSKEGYIASYASVKSPLPQSNGETSFTCTISVSFGRFVRIAVPVDHRRIPDTTEAIPIVDTPTPFWGTSQTLTEQTSAAGKTLVLSTDELILYVSVALTILISTGIVSVLVISSIRCHRSPAVQQRCESDKRLMTVDLLLNV